MVPLHPKKGRGRLHSEKGMEGGVGVNREGRREIPLGLNRHILGKLKKSEIGF